MRAERVLLVTVGTGDMDRPEDTLLAPLKLSIAAGEWARVILLPSQSTVPQAESLRTALPSQKHAIEIRPLPDAGDEESADACFAHYDAVVRELRQRGVDVLDIGADFTRGTKAMSAALVLAAVRHGLPRLRYVSGAARDTRGVVVAGSERVVDIATTVATAMRLLDRATELFRAGNFAAALSILPEPSSAFSSLWPADGRAAAEAVRALAAFYGAWDRLDYRSAEGTKLPDEVPVEWRAAVPRSAVREWVWQLGQPLPDDYAARANRLRALVCDLFANGERRLRDREYEDAILRAYRALEMIGQARLFDRGLDSASLPPVHDAVVQLKEKLRKSKDAPLAEEKNGHLKAAREQVARLLKILGDPLEADLNAMANEGLLRLSARNRSILIHGYEAVCGEDEEPLRDLYGRLETLVMKDGVGAPADRLSLARFHRITSSLA